MSQRRNEELKKHIYCCSEIGAVYHEAAVKYGLSDSAMNILYTIHEIGEGCTQSDVCYLSGISRQTINSAIKKMEKDGWIVLELGKGKMMHIFLTERGRRISEEKLMPLIGAEQRALQKLTSQEQMQLFQLTQKFMESFRDEIRML